MFIIVVKNFSTVVSNEELARSIPDFQTQIRRDFEPAWGVSAALEFLPTDAGVPAGAWTLAVFDDADQAGALGYHDISANGTPLGKVFAKTTIENGGSWTVTFSHELLEMLGDPEINLCAISLDGTRIYAAETCDAVEADELGYDIGETRVSDFVLPAYFQPSAETGVPRSFCGHVTQAFELAPGGYLAFIDLNNPGAGWQQEFARKPGTSRGARRMTAPHARKRSTRA